MQACSGAPAMSSERVDPDLVIRIVDGDEAALERLLLQNYNYLLDHIRRALPNWLAEQMDAEDILQDVHVNVFRHTSEFRGTSLQSFQAWLRSIADNQLRDKLRGATRKKRQGDRRRVRYAERPGHSSLIEFVQLLSADGRNPRSEVAAHEAVHAVQVGIAHLPEDQRRAIELRYVEGKSVPETAEAMHKTPGAIRGLLHRAKIQLKDTLGRSTQWYSKS